MIINIKLPKLTSEGIYFLDFADEIAGSIQEAIENLNAGENVASYEVIGMSKDSVTLDVNITEYN